MGQSGGLSNTELFLCCCQPPNKLTLNSASHAFYIIDHYFFFYLIHTRPKLKTQLSTEVMHGFINRPCGAYTFPHHCLKLDMGAAVELKDPVESSRPAWVLVLTLSHTLSSLLLHGGGVHYLHEECL